MDVSNFSGQHLSLSSGSDEALFLYESPGVYSGHYFFKSRGKDAVKSAKYILNQLFNNHEVNILLGLTPMSKAGARWMNRHLGFKSQGVIEAIEGPCELVMMTKEDWGLLKERN